MAFEVMVKLLGDGSGFNRMLGGAEARADRFAGAIKSRLAGAFTVATLIAYSKQTAAYADRLVDLSSRLEVSTDKLQEWDYAAKMGSTTLEAFTTAVQQLAKARGEALKNPIGDKMNIFRALGIDEAALKNTPLEKLFERIAETIRTTDFGADELAIVQSILGEIGTQLLPAFKSGLEASAAAARDLGIILEDDVISQLDKAAASATKVGTAMQRWGAPILVFVIDRLKEITQLLELGFKTSRGFLGGFAEGWVGGAANAKPPKPPNPEKPEFKTLGMDEPFTPSLRASMQNLSFIWHNLKQKFPALDPRRNIKPQFLDPQVYKVAFRSGVAGMRGESGAFLDKLAAESTDKPQPERTPRDVSSLLSKASNNLKASQAAREEEALKEKLLALDLKLLDTAARRAKLEELISEQITLAKFIPDREAQLEAVQRMLDLAGQLEAISSDKPDKQTAPSFDSLARIGGFTGPGTSERQEQLLRSVEINTRDTKESGKRTLEEVKRLAAAVLDV